MHMTDSGVYACWTIADRVATGNHQRSKFTIKRLQMYKSGGSVIRYTFDI